jgi:hypothetical protein
MSKSMIFQGEKSNKILVLFLSFKHRNKQEIFVPLFFFFFPQFCGIKQTFAEVLKKLAKSVKFSVFFFKKPFFSRKTKEQLSGKKYNFLFWVCQDTRKKKKKTLKFRKFISLLN